MVTEVTKQTDGENIYEYDYKEQREAEWLRTLIEKSNLGYLVAHLRISYCITYSLKG